jgi:cytochrome c oxidase subunit 2
MRNVLHFVVMAILTLLVTLGVYYGLTNLGLMPIEASAQSIPIDWLFNIEVWLTAFFFALIMVPLLYSLVVFRRRKGEKGDGEHIEGHTGLEITWMVIPLIIVIWLGIVGADNLRAVRAVDPDAFEIKVTASQWHWQFEYPHGVLSDVLHLPANKQVVLKMQSRDVLHSFWVPEFRVKQDVVPGLITDYRVTPNRIGNYKVRCAELCGTKHSVMEQAVIVESEADYKKWLDGETSKAIIAEQTAIADPNPSASRGEKLYSQIGCIGCHSLDGAKGIGPTWKGLFDSEVGLSDGSVVHADEAYLTESIKFPLKKIVEGFKPGMPDFGLSDKQIGDLVAFIKTVK